jgi:HSP20 family molecular chaperone IbpA
MSIINELVNSVLDSKNAFEIIDILVKKYTSEISLYTDIYETTNQIIVLIDIPGIEPKDLDIEFCNNIINIKGERKKDIKETAAKSEICYGKFCKKINLPLSITKKNSVSTSFKNGVLKITIDKLNEMTNKFKIDIKA